MGTPVLNQNGAQLGNSRVFIQQNPTPTNTPTYQGCMMIGESEQDLGGVEPIYCPSSSQYNKWDIVDLQRSAPALGTFDITLRMARDGRDNLRSIAEQGCQFNLYQKWACAGLPNDINAYDYIDLFEFSVLTSLTTPQSNPLSGDDNAPADLTAAASYMNRYRILKLTFEERADTTVVAEVLDGFFYDAISCGNCSPISDGCQKEYWLTAASGGSPGLSSQVVRTINGGSTYATIDIVPLGGADARRHTAVGQYDVVVSATVLGHVYSTFTDLDNGTSAWTLLATGYVATKFPRAIWSKNPSQTYIAAAGGYIYLMTDPTSPVTVLTDGSVSTQNLNDIHGAGNVVLAVGASNVVLYSTSAGDSFASITGPAVGVNLTGCWVVSDSIWWVLAGNGTLWYTMNAGVTWTQRGLPSLGAAPVLNDIWFASPSVGFLAAEGGGIGKVLSTIDCGASWQLASTTNNRLRNPPTTPVRFNVVTACDVNTCGIGGRKTVGGDGIISVAK